MIVYGGYAAHTLKLGRASAGGYAPNRAYLLRHATPAAAVGAGGVDGGDARLNEAAAATA